MLPRDKSTPCIPPVNPQDPSTWLAPDQPLVGADGRDWSWAYVWFEDIPGYPGYKVESHGTAWTSLAGSGYGKWAPGETWTRKSSCFCSNDYVNVNLYNSGKRRMFGVHAVVLMAFVGPCPPGMEGCHGNGDRTDNRLENLRWGTPEQNSEDRDRHGNTCRGERQAPSKLKESDVLLMRQLYSEGWPQRRLAKRFGVHQTNVSLIVRRKHWAHI